jgi:opacity protein-like surface antigen
VYLDSILSLPLDDGFEAKGILGVGVFHTKTYGSSNSLLYPSNSTEDSIGVRAGLGLQYNFDKHWAADISYRFQTNCNIFLGFMSIYSVGIKYHF